MRMRYATICLGLQLVLTGIAVAAPPDTLQQVLPPTPKMEYQAKSRLWLWKNVDSISQSLMFHYRPRSPLLRLPGFRPDSPSSTGSPGANRDFQNRSDYLKDYAQWELSSEIAKGSQPLLLSINDFARAVNQYFQKIEKKDKVERLPRNFILSNEEIDMLAVLWRAPDITAAEWYMAYNRLPDRVNLPFLVFEQTIARLVQHGFVEQRTITVNFIDKLKKPHRKYTAIFSRATILQGVRSELVHSDALSRAHRHFELLRMKSRLQEDHDSIFN